MLNLCHFVIINNNYSNYYYYKINNNNCLLFRLLFFIYSWWREQYGSYQRSNYSMIFVTSIFFRKCVLFEMHHFYVKYRAIRTFETLIHFLQMLSDLTSY